MKNEFVHLTFKTDRKTSFYLSQIAHMQGITQPELIDELCKNYIEWFLQKAREMGEQEKAPT